MNEKTDSLPINRWNNRWNNRKDRYGGNLMDFTTLYYNCTIGELARQLQQNISFQPPDFRHAKQILKEDKTIIAKETRLHSSNLLNHLKRCSIPLELSDQCCL